MFMMGIFVFQFALRLHYLFRWGGPALLTSVYVILPSLIDFLASVGVLVCSDTFRSYLFFLS